MRSYRSLTVFKWFWQTHNFFNCWNWFIPPPFIGKKKINTFVMIYRRSSRSEERKKPQERPKRIGKQTLGIITILLLLSQWIYFRCADLISYSYVWFAGLSVWLCEAHARIRAQHVSSILLAVHCKSYVNFQQQQQQKHQKCPARLWIADIHPKMSTKLGTHIAY